MHFTQLTDWLAWLENLHPQLIDMRHSRMARLSKIARALNVLPFPSKVVTVGGTNGKGSTVATLESILSAAGYQVGTYTSPHLCVYNERVRLLQQQVDDARLCAAFAEIERVRGEETLSYFEFGTLAALLIFAEANLDVVLLEVGMGGRLDAVNIVDPDIAIITTIAIDHVKWLGDTRELIGREKAGIFRRGTPAICGDPEVPASVRDYARTLPALLYCQGVDFGYQCGETTWTWWNSHQRLSDLPIPRVELQNAATALQAIACLVEQGFTVDTNALQCGLSATFLPGRFHVISGAVTHVLDVAHNPESAHLLAKRLAKMPCVGKTHAVVAMLTDKDQKASMLPLQDGVDSWYVAGLDDPRGDQGFALMDCLCELGVAQSQRFPSVMAAYQAASQEAKKGDRIVVFGSFHTVAPVLELLLK